MEQKQLNPKNPADAVKIIDILTAELTLKRKEGDIFAVALHTLSTFVELHSEKKEPGKQKTNGKTNLPKHPNPPEPPKSRNLKPA